LDHFFNSLLKAKRIEATALALDAAAIKADTMSAALAAEVFA
jgi:hypothetical protein